MPAIAPYCVAQDIAETLPRVLGRVTSTNARLSVEDLTKLCRRVSAEMDTRFSIKGYAVPVDASASETLLEFLQGVAINGVCFRVLRSVYTTGDVNFELADAYERQYYADITRIEENGFGEDVAVQTIGTVTQQGTPRVGPEYNPTFTLKNGINPSSYQEPG